MSTVTCTEKMTFGPSQNEVWLEIPGLEWSPRRGGYWIMSVPGGKLKVRGNLHREIKTLQQARDALSYLICAAEAEPDQARVEVFRAGKGPSDKSLKVRLRARWPGARQLDGFDGGPQWRDHVLTLPQSLIEEVGAGRLTEPVWIISKKLEEIYRYKPYLEANWPCQSIEEMFAPVLEKAARREVAASALRELIRLEDIRSTTLEEAEAGLRWLRADRDLADWNEHNKEKSAENLLQMADHAADETGRIAADKLVQMRDEAVQSWRERRIYSFRPFLDSTEPRAVDLRASLRRMNIDGENLRRAISRTATHLVLGEVEDALLYLNCDESISYMKEGSPYTPDAGLAALTKLEELLNQRLQAA